MLNKLLNWFRRPKWEEFRDEPGKLRSGGVIHVPAGTLPNTVFDISPREPQWRTNFSLTAAQRRQRSIKAAATRKANKAKARARSEGMIIEGCTFYRTDECGVTFDQAKSNGE